MAKQKKNLSDTYYKNPNAYKIEGIDSKCMIVDDVTQLNKILVSDVFVPKSIDLLIDYIKKTTNPISVGGGRFSMGGQTASNLTTHIDTRELNNIVSFNKEEKKIRVEAGIRWCDIQKFIDPKNLSVKIMQTYANFTVGGSISVNVHGRYIGLGPLILSVVSLKILLANGETIEVNREQNYDVFKAVIGGYNFVGIILEVELDLDDNVNVKRVNNRMKTSNYLDFFKKNVRENKKVIFHNSDLYPPHYNTCNSVNWVETNEDITTETRLQKVDRNYFLEKYYFWVFSETKFGKFRREHFLDPILFLPKKIHTRNYEAGYCVTELEPISRKKSTYVLQEYFVPIEKFDEFVQKMGDIYRRYNVNIINISVRHAFPDLESNLSWARKESFAFVVYYKQLTNDVEKEKVSIWHRELIEAVILVGGAYYLPYQPHATFEQFKMAYPNYEKTFKLKEELDPNLRFRNILIDKYYNTYLGKKTNINQYINTFELNENNKNSEFHKIFSNTILNDKLYLFLQNIYHLYPENDFFHLIKDSTKKFDSDKEIYTYIQKHLVNIKPILSDVIYGLPALKKQKKVIIEQLSILLDNNKNINGYLEIGTTGRHIIDLKQIISLKGDIYTINYTSPNYSLAEIFERGSITKISKHYSLDNYKPITDNIAKNSLDLVFMPIGLHHIHKENLENFIKSISDVLRKGSVFILRDHNAGSNEKKLHCSNIHSVFNLGLNIDYSDNKKEYRNFNSLDYWIKLLDKYGLVQEGKMLLQDNDPSLNTLLKFIKK